MLLDRKRFKLAIKQDFAQRLLAALGALGGCHSVSPRVPYHGGAVQPRMRAFRNSPAQARRYCGAFPVGGAWYAGAFRVGCAGGGRMLGMARTVIAGLAMMAALGG